MVIFSSEVIYFIAQQEEAITRNHLRSAGKTLCLLVINMYDSAKLLHKVCHFNVGCLFQLLYLVKVSIHNVVVFRTFFLQLRLLVLTRIFQKQRRKK